MSRSERDDRRDAIEDRPKPRGERKKPVVELANPHGLSAGERILVCINEDPRCVGLVRHAKRLSDRLHAPFVALAVETARSVRLSEVERDRIADTLRLAQALGGEAATIPGGDRRIADDIISYAQANNVTQIILGKSTRSRWFEILHGSVVHDLVRRAGNISINVIAGDQLPGDPIPKKTVKVTGRVTVFNWFRLSDESVNVPSRVKSSAWPPKRKARTLATIKIPAIKAAVNIECASSIVRNKLGLRCR